MSEKGTQQRDVPKNYFFLTFWFEIIQTLWVFYSTNLSATYYAKNETKVWFDEYGTKFWRIDDSKVV